MIAQLRIARRARSLNSTILRVEAARVGEELDQTMAARCARRTPARQEQARRSWRDCMRICRSSGRPATASKTLQSASVPHPHLVPSRIPNCRLNRALTLSRPRHLPWPFYRFLPPNTFGILGRAPRTWNWSHAYQQPARGADAPSDQNHPSKSVTVRRICSCLRSWHQ